MFTWAPIVRPVAAKFLHVQQTRYVDAVVQWAPQNIRRRLSPMISRQCL